MAQVQENSSRCAYLSHGPDVFDLLNGKWFSCSICHRYHTGRDRLHAERLHHPSTRPIRDMRDLDAARPLNSNVESGSTPKMEKNKRAKNGQRQMKGIRAANFKKSKNRTQKRVARQKASTGPVNTHGGIGGTGVVETSQQKRMQPKRMSKDNAITMIYLNLNTLK